MASGHSRHKRLISVLEAQVTEAGASSDKVGEQRERNHRYYTISDLGNEREGRSHYVSPDVFDVVEGKKAYFTETFFSGRQPVKFAPGDYGKQQADEKTAYVNRTLKRNNWYALARDGWHDAFVAKRMVVLPEWTDDEDTIVQTVEGFTEQDLMQMVQQDPAIVDVVPMDGQTQQIAAGTGVVSLFTGTLQIIRDTSYVKLTLVQPERYYRDPNVAYVIDGMYAGFDEDIARAEMITRGYDPTQVSELHPEYAFKASQEDSNRKHHDASWTRRNMHNRSAETETVTVYKTWTWLNAADYEELAGEEANRRGQSAIDPDALGLYEIHWSCGEVLRWADGRLAIRQAEEIPFHEWTEYKIAHAEYGMAVADTVAHTQRTNSGLKRLIIDNQNQVNTSRYEAVMNRVENPRDLLDNPIGGVVWTKGIGSIAPLPTPPLSPVVFNTIEMLDQDKEERSGLSRLAQGLNTDAVRYQNAADMVERLTNAADRRIMRAARDFAEDFMIPLMKSIVMIAAANDDKTYMVEVAGQYVPSVPSQWDVRDLVCETHVALTPDEGLKFAQSLLMMDAQMTAKTQANPVWGALYGPAQQHALYDDVFDALGITDTSRYMARPDSPEVTQAMQQMSQQQQMIQAMQQQMQEFQMGLLQSNDQREWYKTQLDSGKLQIEAADKAADNLREDDKLEHQKVVDFRELKLEEKQGKDVARSTSVAGG